MQQNENEEYFLRYSKLKDLILSAYADSYCLKAFEDYNERENKEIKLPYKQYYVINHFGFLLRADLCLSLWKMYFDITPACNSIQHLNGYIRKHSDNDRIIALESKELSLPDEIESIENDIKNIRKKFLAHYDFEKSGAKVDTNRMIAMLGFVKGIFNRLCFPDLDYRVTPITEDDLLWQREVYFEGLCSIIRQSSSYQKHNSTVKEDSSNA